LNPGAAAAKFHFWQNLLPQLDFENTKKNRKITFWLFANTRFILLLVLLLG
jgi:hypothetical protein